MVAYTENGCHVHKLSLKLNGIIARTFTNICLFKEQKNKLCSSYLIISANVFDA